MADGQRSDCKAVQPRGAERESTPRNPQPVHRSREDSGSRRTRSGSPSSAASTGKRPDTQEAADRESHLKRKYGMTLEDYERMFEAQGGVCAICGEARPEERTLHVDHDHETGVIRGLLCFRCNNALGDFREEYELFRRAADYLDRDDELAALVRERVGALTG